MAEDRIVKLCWVGPRSICLVMTNFQMGVVNITRRLIIWQRRVRPNILKTVQDKDILTMED